MHEPYARFIADDSIFSTGSCFYSSIPPIVEDVSAHNKHMLFKYRQRYSLKVKAHVQFPQDTLHVVYCSLLSRTRTIVRMEDWVFII
jgi:hypothetical protein